MSNAKMTVATLNEELAALKAVVAEMAKQLEALEVSNVQLRAEVLELKATKSVAPKPTTAKPVEPKQDDSGVYTFIPANCNVTAVATKSREAVKLDGAIVACTPQVWAFWKTQLERKAKVSAREQAQYEEYCA